MTNQEANQALKSLYAIARTAPVDGDTGDVRDNCARLLQDAIKEHVPLEEEKEEE